MTDAIMVTLPELNLRSIQQQWNMLCKIPPPPPPPPSLKILECEGMGKEFYLNK